MWKDRVVQVGIGKRSADGTPEASSPVTTERLVLVLEKAERIVKVAAVGVAGYVLLDTFRQVQIAKAVKEIE